MLPLLRYAAALPSYYFADAVKALSDEFQLTEEEREALLPGGSQRLFTNRVSWAQMYLKKAGALDSIGRATYAITERGRQLLAQNLSTIDNSVLRQFQEFTAFEGQRGSTEASSSEKVDSSSPVQELDPFESFNRSYLALRQNLADELLETLKRTDPTFFEQLVVDLLVAMGYGGSDTEIRAAAMKGSTDQGIDGVIKEDLLGLSHIYLQAKRWKESVGRPTVQGFAGSMDQFHATKGVMITTSTFTEGARSYINQIGKTIILIDGRQLVQLMIEHGLGVKTVETYKIQAIDYSYYELEGLNPAQAGIDSKSG